MTYYMLILEVNVTQGMLNRSVYCSGCAASDLPDKEVGGVTYKVVEVTHSKAESTDIFDSYTWYSLQELQAL